MCSVLTPTVISALVKGDFGENMGHLHRVSFFLFALLFLSFPSHSYMTLWPSSYNLSSISNFYSHVYCPSMFKQD